MIIWQTNRHNKKSGDFLLKIFLTISLFNLLEKKYNPMSFGYSIITLPTYREILKKYRKMAITAKKIFSEKKKTLLDSHEE